MRQSLEASAYDHTNERFRDSVIDLYTKMRTTWERVVEEILFNKTVQRFRSEIMTQSLKAACSNTQQDYPVIFEGYEENVPLLWACDRAEDLPPELPSFEEIHRDTSNEHFSPPMHGRRTRALEERLKGYEGGIEPVLL